MRGFLRGARRRLIWLLTTRIARGDAGLSSMEMAVLAAILLTMATTLGLAMTGKLDSLMGAFTSKS
jgi:hypothetical protein